mmetsp:Transcript_8938/g.22886  ORF Transcript_8938/g.22886 Transcript_8938/m.22886 type:complete len:258 (+) Transcript_8938:360-1133(+)
MRKCSTASAVLPCNRSACANVLRACTVARSAAGATAPAPAPVPPARLRSEDRCRASASLARGAPPKATSSWASASRDSSASGLCAPSDFSRPRSARRCIRSASAATVSPFPLTTVAPPPWSDLAVSVDAKLKAEESAAGASEPKAFRRPSKAIRYNCSASPCRFRASRTNPKLLAVVKVSRWFAPRESAIPRYAQRCKLSASSSCPELRSVPPNAIAACKVSRCFGPKRCLTNRKAERCTSTASAECPLSSRCHASR